MHRINDYFLRSRLPLVLAAAFFIGFVVLVFWSVMMRDRLDLLYAVAYTVQFAVVLPGLLLLEWRIQRWLLAFAGAFIAFAFIGTTMFGEEFDRGPISRLWTVVFAVMPVVWWVGFGLSLVLGIVGWRRYFRFRHNESR